MNKPAPLSEDLLTGAKAIAEYLGWPERKVFYGKKYLPIGTVGRTLIARKSELDRALSALPRDSGVFLVENGNPSGLHH